MPDLAPDPAAAAEIEATPPHFGPGDAGRILTADDFAHAIYEAPWVYERVDGRLVVMSPEGWEHIDTTEPWRDQLVFYKLQRPGVIYRVVGQPWVRVDGMNDRIGDIGVYLVGERDGEKIPRRIPDLMFEFVSPGRADRFRDYVLKRDHYQKVGVREYVIVDRFDRKVTVLTLGADGYAARVLGAGDVYESPLLPGLVIVLDEVWPS